MCRYSTNDRRHPMKYAFPSNGDSHLTEKLRKLSKNHASLFSIPEEMMVVMRNTKMNDLYYKKAFYNS